MRSLVATYVLSVIQRLRIMFTFLQWTHRTVLVHQRHIPRVERRWQYQQGMET